MEKKTHHLFKSTNISLLFRSFSFQTLIKLLKRIEIFAPLNKLRILSNTLKAGNLGSIEGYIRKGDEILLI